MIRSRLSAIALLIAALAVTACSNPTAPAPATPSAAIVGGSAI